jgi:hypothetical protein
MSAPGMCKGTSLQRNLICIADMAADVMNDLDPPPEQRNGRWNPLKCLERYHQFHTCSLQRCKRVTAAASN